MKEQFLELIRILLGESNPIRGTLTDYQRQIDDCAERLNALLGLTSDTKLKTKDETGSVFGPVPFSSTNYSEEKVRYAIMGLNPKLDPNEKLKAGLDVLQYADFYTRPHSLLTDGDIGKFYRSIAILMNSLQARDVVTWGEFTAGCSTPAEKNAAFLELVRQYPIGVWEFIPFHSNSMKSFSEATIERLLRAMPQYEDYLAAVFKSIDGALGDDGWVICNGTGPSNTMDAFIAKGRIAGDFVLCRDAKDEAAYRLYCWRKGNKSRKVLLCYHFVGAAGSGLKLASYSDIGRMIRDVTSTSRECDSTRAK